MYKDMYKKIALVLAMVMAFMAIPAVGVSAAGNVAENWDNVKIDVNARAALNNNQELTLMVMFSPSEGVDGTMLAPADIALQIYYKEGDADAPDNTMKTEDKPEAEVLVSSGSAIGSASGLRVIHMPNVPGTRTYYAVIMGMSNSSGLYPKGLGLSNPVTITVTPPVLVESITVTSASGAAITEDNGTLQLSAAVAPEDATNKGVTWSVVKGTGDANISDAGLLMAVADGTVTAKATALDGSDVEGSFEVTISGQQPDIPIQFTGLNANGAPGTETTTALTLAFDSEPVGLTVSDITVTGATKGTLSGEGTTRTLTVTDVTVKDGEDITVALAKPGFVFTPASNTVAVSVLKLADKTVLFQTMNDAADTTDNIKISEDGKGLTATTEWVTQAVYDAFTEAVRVATVAYHNEALSQAEEDKAVTALKAAMDAFNAAKKYGIPFSVAFTGLTANGTPGTETTTALTLTLDGDPVGLTLSDITVTGAVKGTLSGEGATRTLNVTGFTVKDGGEVTVALAKPGFVFTPAERTVAVTVLPPADTDVLYQTIEDAGDAAINIELSEDGIGLPATTEWVTQEAYDAFSKAVYDAFMISYKEGLTQAEADKAVADLKAAIDTFNAAKKYGIPFAVAFTGLTANGVPGTQTTTALTLTFDGDPAGLALSDITVTGATKGTLSGEGATRTLTITGITVNDGEDITVALAKTGFAFTPASRTVAVAVVDTTVLFQTLTDALDALLNVEASADGIGLSATTEWVTQAVYDAFTEALNAADAVYNKEGVTQAEADKAATALKVAIEDFKAAKKYGTPFTVTFTDWDDSVIATQAVAKGQAAEAPEDPTREGYLFTGWDAAFDNVQGDLTVKAQYKNAAAFISGTTYLYTGGTKAPMTSYNWGATSVTVYKRTANGTPERTPIGYARSDTDGHYQFDVSEYPSDNGYILQAYSPFLVWSRTLLSEDETRVDALRRRVVLKPQAGVDFTFTDPVTIMGRVVDGSGNPVQGASVSINDSVQTDSLGGFASIPNSTNVGSNRVSVNVSLSGYYSVYKNYTINLTIDDLKRGTYNIGDIKIDKRPAGGVYGDPARNSFTISPNPTAPGAVSNATLRLRANARTTLTRQVITFTAENGAKILAQGNGKIGVTKVYTDSSGKTVTEKVNLNNVNSGADNCVITTADNNNGYAQLVIQLNIDANADYIISFGVEAPSDPNATHYSVTAKVEDTVIGKPIVTLNSINLTVPGEVATYDTFQAYGEVITDTDAALELTVTSKATGNVVAAKTMSITKKMGTYYKFTDIGPLNEEGVYTVKVEIKSGVAAGISASADMLVVNNPIKVTEMSLYDTYNSVTMVNPKPGEFFTFTGWVETDYYTGQMVSMDDRALTGRVTLNDASGIASAKFVLKTSAGTFEYPVTASGNSFITLLNRYKGTGKASITFEAIKKDGSALSFIVGRMVILIDPSGYVYDAVTGERVENAVTTLYYKDPGASAWELWPAEDYAQVNPMKSDAEGKYGWMVPDGYIYLVTAAKEGYKNYDTAADYGDIPVLPEQKAINIALQPINSEPPVKPPVDEDPPVNYYPVTPPTNSNVTYNYDYNNVAVNQGVTSTKNVATVDKADGEPAVATVEVNVKPNTKGQATFAVTNATISNAISKAKTFNAKLNKADRADGTMVEVFAAAEKDITGMTVRLDKTALQSLSAAGFGLVVHSDASFIELDADAVKELLKSNTNIRYSITLVAKQTTDYPAYNVVFKDTRNRNVAELENGVVTFGIYNEAYPDGAGVAEIEKNQANPVADSSVTDGWLRWTGGANGVFTVK